MLQKPPGSLNSKKFCGTQPHHHYLLLLAGHRGGAGDDRLPSARHQQRRRAQRERVRGGLHEGHLPPRAPQQCAVKESHRR